MGLDKLFKILDGLGLNLLVVPKREVPVARSALRDHATARVTVPEPNEGNSYARDQR